MPHGGAAMKTVLRFPSSILPAVLLISCFLWVFAAFIPPPTVPYSAAAYADRAKLRNSTGVTGLGSYASPAACPAQVNLFSQNVTYSLPIISLPGRAGLSLSLTLAYNSKVWIKSGSTIYFDGDKGWPAVGWRLGFGRVDGKYSGPDGYDHYYLISGDGSVRDLRYNASTGLYESKDSTWMDFNDSTGVLRMKDGTQITYQTIGGSGGYVMPTQIKDRNGNYLTINYTGTAQQISSIVDTVGRTTTFTYNGDGTLATISKSGFGGPARTWTFGYTNVTLSYNFGSLTVNGATNGSQVKVLSSITYPNQTKQTFSYNGYAQLTEVAWKSNNDTLRGQPLLITWQATPGGGWSDSPTPSQVGHNDGTTTTNWSLTFNTYSTTVTDPASVPRTTTFLQTGSWDDGLPSQTTIGSPVLRTVANVWSQDGSWINPRLTRVTTTLNDTGQQSKVEYDYTSYGNVSEVREYDYGLVLARKTTTTYVTAPNYTTRHILGLPSTVIVYDAGGTAKSRTEYTYDAAALAYAGGAANHDDVNYGTGFTYRGLVTEVKRYTNAAAPSGPISNTSTYDMLGNLLSESADCCVQRVYNYSATTQFSQPDSVVRGSGTTLTTSSTYDSHTGLTASSTDENNQTTNFNYDVADRTTSVTRPDGTVLSTSYDDTAATPSATSTTPIESGKSVKNKTEMDGLGRTVRSIAMDINNTVYSKGDTQYDSVGRAWRVSNPYTGASPTYWTETQYDALGRVSKVIPPDGSATSNNISYAYSGNKVTTTDPAGKQGRTYTDALGRTTRVDEPGYSDGSSGTGSATVSGEPFCISWDPPVCAEWDTGTVWITVNGFTALAGYGGFSTASGLASALRNQFNTDPASPVTAGGTGGVVSLTAKQAGAHTNYSLTAGCTGGGAFCADASGPTLTGGADGTGANGSQPSIATPLITIYTYDVLDNVTVLTQGVQQRTASYDGLGRKTSETTPEAGTVSYVYNNDGLVTSRTDARGVVTAYTYDGVSRLKTISYTTTGTSAAATAAVEYFYDEGGAAANAMGRLTRITDGAGTETYQYDLLGRVTQVTKTIGGTNYPTLYTYNLAGQVTSVTYPSTRQVSQTVDAIGRLSTLAPATGTNYVSGFQYDPAGVPTQFDYGSGVRATIAYNSRLQRTSLAYRKDTSELLELAYGYAQGSGNNGQIASITDNTANGANPPEAGRTVNYSYDAWRRAKTATTTGSTGYAGELYTSLPCPQKQRT
jgi:YD repeat-containing protein